uniref:Uncharacterized protein n=1 Tax=Mesocestoides corti TaxID=53468 RepID=A0A5K3G6I7_MESCO
MIFKQKAMAVAQTQSTIMENRSKNWLATTPCWHEVTAETFMNFTFNEIAKTKRKQRQQREASEYRSPPIVTTVSALVTNQSPSSQVVKLSAAQPSSPMAQDASIRQSIANMTERTHIRFNG